jgi:hypothetical protein
MCYGLNILLLRKIRKGFSRGEGACTFQPSGCRAKIKKGEKSMSKMNAKWINKDAQSLENDGNNLRVKVDGSGALERTADGLNIKTGGVTNNQLAGNIAFDKLADNANIARLDQDETVAGNWNFTNAPTAGGDPTTDNQLARKAYVDAVAQGLDIKGSVKALSDSNLSLSGAQTIDGVSLLDGDRVLLSGQTDASENGIWIVRATAWERPVDFDTGISVASAFCFVEEGTSYADSGWVCTSDGGSDVVDTDDLAFTQFSGAGSIAAGSGLEKTGNTLSVKVADLISGGAAEIDGDKLDIDYSPSNYTPDTTPAVVDNASELSAHLAGIDNALAGISTENITQEMHTVTAGEVTAGYFSLGNAPVNAQAVRMTVMGGPMQVNKQTIGATGATADFDVLNSTELHFNNNGAATALSGDIEEGDVLILEYQQ